MSTFTIIRRASVPASLFTDDYLNLEMKRKLLEELHKRKRKWD